MTNQIKKVFTLFSIVVIISILFSHCVKTPKCNEPYRFTQDELKWIDWQDTIYYLVNNVDTVFIINNRYSHDNEHPFPEDGGCLFYEEGVNSIGFQNEKKVDFISVASLNIKKPNAKLEVEIYVHPTHNQSTTFIPLQGTIDTSTIYGQFYSEVYKFEGDSVDEIYTKTVFFAKNYGFLKIELNNGNKIELLTSK